MTRYQTADGGLDWERVQTMLTDISDGYLSALSGVEYGNASGAPEIRRLLGGESDVDADPDVLGSRLLRLISTLHDIVRDHAISGEPEDETLYRLVKFAPVTSKLSDAYAMKDATYREHWHDDVISICDAIADCQDA